MKEVKGDLIKRWRKKGGKRKDWRGIDGIMDGKWDGKKEKNRLEDENNEYKWRVVRIELREDVVIIIDWGKGW